MKSSLHFEVETSFLKRVVPNLPSNVDTARLHERKIANFLYKKAETDKGSPLNEAEKKHIRDTVLPKFLTARLLAAKTVSEDYGSFMFYNLPDVDAHDYLSGVSYILYKMNSIYSVK